ncbi:malate dehydrogenase [Tatumella ptyseos]|uniref:PD-(D/E)XK nuclease domain-containing protein n=1 Tax=Tatumella ptyseos TaxID=82987 RepID=UPI0023F0E52F|nr:malate dehydrogenase [Tatumella ptyseos]
MGNKTLADRFDVLEVDYQHLLSTKYVKYNQSFNSEMQYVDEGKYNTWLGRTKNLLADCYGKDSVFYNDFLKAQKKLCASNYQVLTKNLKPVFDAAKADFPHTLPNNDLDIKGTNNLEVLINILEKFPAFCRQLRKRYSDRITIEVKDEYDVQDLIHALLTLHFDDIRPEEVSPSYAGSSSRQDFLLKKEKIVIEVKKTRKSLGASKIGEELIIDMSRYHKHPDCDILVCFVYDPECWVNNPNGLIADLEESDKEGKTRVVIAQF